MTILTARCKLSSSLKVEFDGLNVILSSGRNRISLNPDAYTALLEFTSTIFEKLVGRNFRPENVN